MKGLIVGLMLLLVALQLRLWQGDGGIVEVWALQEQLIQQTQTVETLQQRNQLLEAEVQDLKHRLGALEERARTDLGMIKQGETFFQDLH